MRALLLVLCIVAACRDASDPVPRAPEPVRHALPPPPPELTEVEEADEPADGVDVAEVLAALEQRTSAEHDTEVGAILDVEDRCPDEPVDHDGYEDIDGCPEPVP